MSESVAIITGGAGDLAQGLSKILTESGFLVKAPGRGELDVTSAESVQNYFDDIGPLTLLINNAGITADGLFIRQKLEQRDHLIDTNLKGSHLCSQAAARIMMRQRDGHIINIGSYSALDPPAGQSAYAASKAGLIGLTKSYAKEFGKRNIRVNCVLPGFLETRMTANLSEAAKAAALEKHQLARFNTVEEAARFIHYLSTTHHISGQIFQLDSRT